MIRKRHQPRQIVYPFPLRPDFLASLTLPVDLTPDEAEKLGVFLRTLAVPALDTSSNGDSCTIFADQEDTMNEHTVETEPLVDAVDRLLHCIFIDYSGRTMSTMMGDAVELARRAYMRERDARNEGHTDFPVMNLETRDWL